MLFESKLSRSQLGEEANRYVNRASAMLRRVSVVLAANREIPIQHLNSRREKLSGILQGYQKFKHTHIFDPVISHGSASSKVIARTMKVDCISLGQNFSLYVDRWRGLTVSDYAAYKTDMIAMSESMLTSLSNELRAIHQLILVADLYR